MATSTTPKPSNPPAGQPVKRLEPPAGLGQGVLYTPDGQKWWVGFTTSARTAAPAAPAAPALPNPSSGGASPKAPAAPTPAPRATADILIWDVDAANWTLLIGVAEGGDETPYFVANSDSGSGAGQYKAPPPVPPRPPAA